MTISITKAIAIAAYPILTVCMVACQQDVVEAPTTGCLVLNVSEVSLYTDMDTRGALPNDHATFICTFEGTNGNVVSTTLGAIESGGTASTTLPADTYTITVQNISDEASQTGNGHPLIKGTTSGIVITPGDQTEATVNMKPANAKVSVTFDATFTDNYENINLSMTTTGSDRTVTLTSASDAYFLVPTDGKVSYTLTAKAKADTHISDIPEDVITGTLTVAAGNCYPLNITAKSISDIMIGFDSGTHNGTFDSNRR